MDIAPDTRFSPGTVIADRYEVSATIGSGGMGLVLLVHDRRLSGEATALKLLHPHAFLSEKSFSRFQNEVRIMRQLTHQNIVRIFDMGKTERGEPFISMEHVDGTNLLELLRERPGNALAFEEAIAILIQVAKGMQVAHERGIIHRDLKPENILITKDGTIKLADFGIARMGDSSQGLTATGETVGTPYYMSPEQIRGEEVDPRADIYAFGILAFELVAGHRPYEKSSFFGILAQHLSQPLPVEQLRVRSVPRWYVEMVGKCCEKDRSHRFPSVTTLLETVEAQLSGDTINKPSVLTFAERIRRRRAKVVQNMGNWPTLTLASALIMLLTVRLCARGSDHFKALLAQPLFTVETTLGIPLDPIYSLFCIDYRPSSESLSHFVKVINQGLPEFAIAAIVASGVNPNVPAQLGGPPPIHEAVATGFNKSMVALLLSGADPDTIFDGDTAFTLALRNGHHIGAATLLKYKANPLLPDGTGKITLDAITKAGGNASALEILSDVLAATPEIQLDVVFDDGTTPLSRSVRFANEQLAKALLHGTTLHTADPLFTEAAGSTPRALALQSTNTSIRKLFSNPEYSK